MKCVDGRLYGVSPWSASGLVFTSVFKAVVAMGTFGVGLGLPSVGMGGLGVGTHDDGRKILEARTGYFHLV